MGGLGRLRLLGRLLPTPSPPPMQPGGLLGLVGWAGKWAGGSGWSGWVVLGCVYV